MHDHDESPGHEPVTMVTVAAYSHPLEARVALGHLEDAGIPCFLADEHIVTMNWTWSNAVGGVRLQVPESAAARAVEMLNSTAAAATLEPAPAADEDTEVCPACGSWKVERQWLGRRLVYALWIVLHVPIPLAWRVERCLDCGRKWRPTLPT